MRKLLLLAVMVAGPAYAQEVYFASETWPVQVSGRTCTVVQAVPDGRNTLSISYDGREVVMTSTNELESELPETGTFDLAIVFLDNGREKFDDGWGSRRFTYTRSDGLYRFSSRFSGEENVRQLLSDLSNSRTVGLLQRREVVVAYPLADIGPSLARLRDCVARQVAAN